MATQKEPSREARDNVTEGNVDTRSGLLPEERTAGGSEDAGSQAEAILAESEERTVHPDADEPQGGHRHSEDAADLT